jgi:ribosomal protein S18 acetylase RimI-like enzyme
MNLEIRRLTEADLDSADIIFRLAFGVQESRKAELALYLRLQPLGEFMATLDGMPVGIVGAMDYGPFTYIGHLSVRPEMQGRGIGRALMERALAWQEARGCPIALLDATEAGTRLYERLGFVGDGRMSEFKRQEHAASSPFSEHVHLFRVEDIPAVADFDAPIFGARRAQVLKGYLDALPERAFIIREGEEQVSGYLFAQSRRLGPWAARRPEDAESLLAAALTLAYDGPPMVLVPESNRAATELLQGFGFHVTRSLCHMRRGGLCSPIQYGMLYGLASFSLG